MSKTTSLPLNRALEYEGVPANSRNVEWTEYAPQATEPVGVGTFVVGTTGGSLLIFPYCDGAPGSQFQMRLWAWRNFGAIGNVNVVVWIPCLLAQVNCVAGKNQGDAVRLLKPGEHLAGTIQLEMPEALANGDRIHSLGSDFTASLKIATDGCQKITFDFKAGPGFGPGMGNALWTHVG